MNRPRKTLKRIMNDWICPDCYGAEFKTTDEDGSFPYGAEPDSVTIECIVPVLTCTDCGCAFTDHRAEEIMDKAIEQHLESLA